MEFYLCLGGLMDKVVDSGSTDTGSIPVRGTIRHSKAKL